MRVSVAFLAVFAVTSCSVGVNGAHFVRSGIRGHGTGRGNEYAPGIEESDFGNGENDGHRIGKRSSLGHDMAKRSAFRSAIARRQQMINPDVPFLKPILLPPNPSSKPVILPDYPLPTPFPHIVEVPPPSEEEWNPPPLGKSRNIPLRQAIPSALGREFPSLTPLKFLPLSEVRDAAVKIVSNALSDAHILPAIIPKLSAKRSSPRRRDSYRSDLKDCCARHLGSRSNLPLRSAQTIPDDLTDDFLPIPLYRNMRNTAPARSDVEENIRMEVRSAVIEYLVQLWDKISQWFKPGSHTGGGKGVLPPKEQIHIQDGKGAGPGLPEEHEVHTEHPPEEYQDDVIIEPVTPPVDDGVDIIHLPLQEDGHETAEDSTGEGVGDVDEVQHVGPQEDTNWEIRNSTRMKGGSRDVASKIRDTSARTRRKNMRDDLDTITNIFGRRMADDY